jgi:uncharacterized protein
VYVEEVSFRARTIDGVPTSVAAFVDCFARGPANGVIQVRSFAEFEREFGGLDPRSGSSYAIELFFRNGGRSAWVVRTGSEPPTPAELLGAGGVLALDTVPYFDLLCLPRPQPPQVVAAAASYCERRRALLLLDPPDNIADPAALEGWLAEAMPQRSANAALYFPRLRAERSLGASGAVAGVYARTDETSGVWTAPAGREAVLRGVAGLELDLTASASDALVSLGVNPLRVFPGLGPVVWGARTLAGAEGAQSDWKYVPVRRLALYLEESIDRGTSWAIFEPNGEPLWAEIRGLVGAFLEDLLRKGAFQGRVSNEAYFVKCDAETASDDVVRVIVGFAPLRPAEFVTIQIQQAAGSYGAARYRIAWNGRYVATAASATGLERAPEAPTEYEPVTLERGVTHDQNFDRWARLGKQVSPAEIVLELVDDTGRPALAYRTSGCWASQYEALPDSDAGADTAAITQITLEHDPS